MDFDHVLLIGFGGPRQPEEVKPFLEEVTRGITLSEARFKEILHHYEVMGGASPYHDETLRLKGKLEEGLKQTGISLPVFVGMRNWHPFLRETMSEIKKRGFRKGIGVVLAPQRSEASYERYLQSVEEARERASAREIEYEYLKSWHDHPLFIRAEADQVRKIYQRFGAEERLKTHLLFSAHSIPEEMARKSNYSQEIKISSSLVAGELNHGRWSVCYQSRSGNPRDPWLEPDVCSVIRELGKEGGKAVLLIPIGFLCENAEILYDLDVEARREAERQGLKYFRASTVMDHPKFVTLLKELIEAECVRV